MLTFLKNSLRRLLNRLFSPIVNVITTQNDILQSQHDFLMRAEWDRSISMAKNPLNRFGAKYFSQTDEDGIIPSR
jgi:hypothetical protein